MNGCEGGFRVHTNTNSASISRILVQILGPVQCILGNNDEEDDLSFEEMIARPRVKLMASVEKFDRGTERGKKGKFSYSVRFMTYIVSICTTL